MGITDIKRQIGFLLMQILVLLPVVTPIQHETNLIWAQNPAWRFTVARLVGVSGDPTAWIPIKKPVVKHISAPHYGWEFKALGFSWRQQKLFWTEGTNKKIQSLTLDGSTETEDIYSGTSPEAPGLAVDWLSENIYWTDSLYNWIKVAPLRPSTLSIHKIILQDNLDNPHGLAVYPKKGYLFFSDWGIWPKIEVCDLLGNNRRILVDDNLQHPRGLALDYDANRLYWVDSGLDTIESILINGNDRMLIRTELGSNFNGIALFKNYVFVTEQTEGVLAVYQKAGGDPVRFTLGNVPFGVIMYDSSQQEGNFSACDNEGCAHMCMEDPISGPKCVCGDGYILADDQKSCNESKLFVHPSHLYAIGSAICMYPANMPDMSLENVTLTSQCILADRYGYLALTFDGRANMLYYSGNYTNTISAIPLENGAKAKVMIGGTGTVKGLALDWIAGNLFWTDSTNAYIKVSRSDGTFQRILIDDNINSPAGIAVHPARGTIYWTDIGIPNDITKKPKVECANMDGTERAVIMDDNLGQPNHIVIDYNKDLLYWSDSKLSHIRQYDLNTKAITIFFAQPDVGFYGISLFKDFILWTDTDDMNGIHAARLDKQRKVRGIIHPNYGLASDVITFDVTQQPNFTSSCSFKDNPCDQLCLPAGNDSLHCLCGVGYNLAEDDSRCMNKVLEDNFILVNDAYQKQIYQVNIKNGVISSVGLKTKHEPIALDYNPMTSHIYWSDNNAHVIAKLPLKATESEIVRKLSEDSVVDGIAVDYVNNLMFYTDTGANIIGVFSMSDPTKHRTLINLELDEPRDIVVSPIFAKLYWSDWGSNASIWTANMDGSDPSVLPITFNSTWLNGLALDVKGNILYWVDGRENLIGSYHINTGIQKVMIVDPSAHFFGLYLMSDYLYVTDWRRNYIRRIHTNGSELYQFGMANFTKLYGISGFNSSEILRAISVCANQHCPHLCIPMPHNQMRCLCSDGFKLENNQCIAETTTTTIADTSTTTTTTIADTSTTTTTIISSSVTSTTTRTASTLGTSTHTVPSSTTTFSTTSKSYPFSTIDREIFHRSSTTESDVYVISSTTSSENNSGELDDGFTDGDTQLPNAGQIIGQAVPYTTIIAIIALIVVILAAAVIVGVLLYRKRRDYTIPHGKLIEENNSSTTFCKVVYPQNGAESVTFDSGIENPTYDVAHPNFAISD